MGAKKILQSNLKILKGNIDCLVGGNATMQIMDFLLTLKTVDQFAAMNRSTLLQVPSFLCRLALDKRTEEVHQFGGKKCKSLTSISLQYATCLDKWPMQLQTLYHVFQQHAHSVYTATNLVLPSDDQDLTHLGLEGRDVMLLMDYQRHTLQEHWMSMASQVDGVAIFMQSLLLISGCAVNAVPNWSSA